MNAMLPYMSYSKLRAHFLELSKLADEFSSFHQIPTVGDVCCPQQWRGNGYLFTQPAVIYGTLHYLCYLFLTGLHFPALNYNLFDEDKNGRSLTTAFIKVGTILRILRSSRICYIDVEDWASKTFSSAIFQSCQERWAHWCTRAGQSCSCPLVLQYFSHVFGIVLAKRWE